MAEEKPNSKWVITLGSGQWGTVQYGVVEYLRRHPRLRVLTAVLGLIWLLGWFASTAGFKWHFAAFPTMAAIFVTPTLLWLAVISGPEFSLRFKEPDPPKPPKPPEEPDAVIDPEGFGIKALNKNYVNADKYGRSSFRWAMFALLMAMVSGSTAAALATGIVTSSIPYLELSLVILTLMLLITCSLLILRSILTFHRATKMHDKMLELQKAITLLKYQERMRVDPSLNKKDPVGEVATRQISLLDALTGSD